MTILLAVALAASTAAASNSNQSEQAAAHIQDTQKFDHAVGLVEQGHPSDAIKLFDELIAGFESHYGNKAKKIYCARSGPEVVLYSGMAAAAKKEAEVLDETFCNSYFFKGFALIDLGRADEAKPLFDKAIEMAPMNSHFLGERAEWYKSRRDWDHAYADFSTASAAAQLSPDRDKSFDQRRAWRGMAYIRTEQRQLDEAEALLRKCLSLDPADDKAKKELFYINSLRHPTS